MKNSILILSTIIILISLSISIFINITINKNISTNKQVLDKFNKIFIEKEIISIYEYEEQLPNLEIYNNDYIGTINIEKDNLLLPIKSKCTNSYLTIESACTYFKNPLIILGSNLKDSFKSFKSYNIDDKISLTSTSGRTIQYKINKIRTIDNIKQILNYNEDLIIVIKNYYNIEYTLLICDLY